MATSAPTGSRSQVGDQAGAVGHADEPPAQRVIAGIIRGLMRATFCGLPPTLIQVGTDELLLTDSRRLHAGLTAAGVEVTLQEFAHRWHVFQLNAGVLADANRALATAGEFVRSHARGASAGGQ